MNAKTPTVTPTATPAAAPSSACLVDHVIVIAPSLQAGGEWVRQQLGVMPQKGGEHALMGTHNLLLSLGPSAYLEVMAINPQASKPAMRRWFGLDDLAPDATPQLRTWVARTRDLPASLAVCTEPMYDLVPMSRGALNWLISSPLGDATANGDSLPARGGLSPTLIQWQTDQHPARTLPDCGLRLLGLELHTTEVARAERLLRALGLLGERAGDPVAVTAHHLAEGDVPGLRWRF